MAPTCNSKLTKNRENTLEWSQKKKKSYSSKKFSLVTEGKKKRLKALHASLLCFEHGRGLGQRAGRPVTFKMISKAKVPVKT